LVDNVNIQKIEIAKLKAAEYNPRVALKPDDKEYEKLKRSIQEFGFVEPIVWNKRTGNVVGGHQRLTVLKGMGEKEIDCVIVDLDSQKEKALNIALNKVQGSWDEDKLAALLSELNASSFDVSKTGFDAAEVDELLNAFYSKEAVEDNFDEEQALKEVKAKGAVTKRGDLWQLGEHLLLCGDSTQEADIRRVLGNERAQVAVTSPPYGVGKEYEKKGIEPWMALIKPVIKNITKYADIVCWNLIDLYSTGTQFIEPTNVYSVNYFAENGYRPIWIRIWKKQGINFGIGAYHLVTNKPAQQYEYITAFGNNAQPEYNDQEYAWVSAYAAHSYKFVKRLTKEERKKWGYAGIWEINTVKANKEHPAMFPVELPWRCIKMHSDKGGIVLEPFCGSGTTIIACEQTGRKCRAIEIMPEYCDVSIRRFEEFSGQKAKVIMKRRYE
jgi:DNA modification methylase